MINDTSAHKIYIVGVGDDGMEGLSSAARQLIQRAKVVVGAPHTLAAVSHGARKIPVENDLEAVVEQLAGVKEPAVVLASGDPLFYGIARYLCQRLGKERFEVLPHVSSMQLAFARVKESWDEAYLANLATTPLTNVVDKIRTAEKVGLFTSDDCTPAMVANALLERKIDYFFGYVCENLGSPDERVTQGELAELAKQTFASLNVMVLVRKPDVPDRPAELAGKRLFGNPDDAFLQSVPKRGLLTSQEVRVIALADLDLGPRSVVWDVGAGSGAVAVEAAQIARDGRTFAIEMDAEDYELIGENAERFGVANLIPIHGQAPEAWKDLPEPDAVFVGGTGEAVAAIARAAFQRLRPGGRLVANVGSIENLVAVRAALSSLTHQIHVRMINIAHGTDQLERMRFESRNPTFLVRAVREPVRSKNGGSQ